MTAPIDDLLRATLEGVNDSYLAGYRDAKADLRRRLTQTAENSADTMSQAAALLATVTKFLTE